MVDPGDQLLEHQQAQQVEVHDHPALRVEFAAHGDLDDPVVAVAIFVVADPVDAPILLRRPSRVVQPVAGGKLLDVADLYDFGRHAAVRRGEAKPWFQGLVHSSRRP